MGDFKAREAAKAAYAADYETEPDLIVLDPIDPIRRAKKDRGLPGAEPGDTPNGTARVGTAEHYGTLTVSDVKAAVEAGDYTPAQVRDFENALPNPRVTVLDAFKE